MNVQQQHHSRQNCFVVQGLKSAEKARELITTPGNVIEKLVFDIIPTRPNPLNRHSLFDRNMWLWIEGLAPVVADPSSRVQYLEVRIAKLRVGRGDRYDIDKPVKFSHQDALEIIHGAARLLMEENNHISTLSFQIWDRQRNDNQPEIPFLATNEETRLSLYHGRFRAAPKLAEALMQPNCRVEVLDGVPLAWMAHLYPSIKSESSLIHSVSVGLNNDPEELKLLELLISLVEQGRLTEISIERIHWLPPSVENALKVTLGQMIRPALEHPNGRLLSLSFHDVSITFSSLDELCFGMQHENTKLEQLSISIDDLDELVGECVAQVLISQYNKLKNFSILARSLCDAALVTIAEALKHPNNRVEKLTVAETVRRPHTTPVQSSLAFMHALESPFNRLLSLSIPFDRTHLSAVVQAVRNRNNKLRYLELLGGPRINLPMELDKHADIIRAFRVSQLITWNVCGTRGSVPWYFSVLQTLISVELVPRLGADSSLRYLPISSLIIQVAQTLAWDLSFT